MIDVSDGFTDITVGQDALAGPWRDPLTAARVPTGAQVKLSFVRRLPLPAHAAVRIRYDLAENGCEREAHGVPRLQNTIMDGEEVCYLYTLTYWLAPQAVMKFCAAPASDQPLAMAG